MPRLGAALLSRTVVALAGRVELSLPQGSTFGESTLLRQRSTSKTPILRGLATAQPCAGPCPPPLVRTRQVPSAWVQRTVLCRNCPGAPGKAVAISGMMQICRRRYSLASPWPLFMPMRNLRRRAHVTLLMLLSLGIPKGVCPWDINSSSRCLCANLAVISSQFGSTMISTGRVDFWPECLESSLASLGERSRA